MSILDIYKINPKYTLQESSLYLLDIFKVIFYAMYEHGKIYSFIYINLYFNINFCKYFLDFDMVVKHMMQKNRCVNIRCVLRICLIHVGRGKQTVMREGGGGRRNGVLLRNSLLFDAAATLHPVDVTLKNTYGI